MSSSHRPQTDPDARSRPAITDRTVVFDWTRATIEGQEWAAAALPAGARGAADPSANFFTPRP